MEGFLTAREMMAAASRLIQDRQSRGATGSMADMFSDKALEEVRCLSNTYMLLFPLVFEQKKIFLAAVSGKGRLLILETLDSRRKSLA